MGTLIKIHSLEAWYTPDKYVLKGLDLTLDEHSVVGLIGLNGAGKTTLMNVLCGLHDGFGCTSQQY